ncbi:MAG: 30S ribosomal protein S20 [Planctomycetota bacterium]
MAHSKSSKKRIRQNEKRRLRNRRRKAQVKESVRGYEEALAAGKADQAADELKKVYRQLDRVAAKGTMHKKTAARKKSRLAKRLSATSG